MNVSDQKRCRFDGNRTAERTGKDSQPAERTAIKESKLMLWIGALFCCMLWGLAPALIKMGYSTMAIASTGSIVVFAGCRFFLAGWLVLLFCLIRKPSSLRIAKKDIRPILTLALFQTFGQYFFYYMGAAHASGVMVSVLSSLSALFALLLSACVFRLEKMSLLKLLGCIVGFLGVLIMNLSPSGFSFSLSGEGMVVLSQISSALSAVLIQIFSRRSSPVLLSGAQFVIGGAGLIIFGLCLPNHSIAWNLNGLLILLALAGVSAGAYTLWGVLLAKYPVSSVGVFGCTIGLFGVAFSALILHEPLTPVVLAAGALTSLGILMVNSSFGLHKKPKVTFSCSLEESDGHTSKNI